jgi:exodeoxyribonuclease V beta subunit
MPIKHTSFDPFTVSLEDSNLIEASAGTGKTYSVAIIALRLILEKDIPVDKILMVTFTNAAVAELELRVRSFIRQALKRARGHEIPDKEIARLIDRLMMPEELGGKVLSRLESAELLLDQTAIMTIHSFCQLALREYAFETGQFFGAETMTSDEHENLVEGCIHEFWRKHITTIKPELLKALVKNGLTLNKLSQVVAEGIKGNEPYLKYPLPHDLLSENHQQELLDKKVDIDEELASIRSEISREVSTRFQEFRHSVLEIGGEVSRYYLDLFEDGDPEVIVEKIFETAGKRYTKKLFSSMTGNLERIVELQQENENFLGNYMMQLSAAALNGAKSEIDRVKQSKGLITFDDMIVLLDRALSDGTSSLQLAEALRRKFPAVAVDEFQDTDRVQSRIFSTLFEKNGILFYIGDPKQSIYAFRKADIVNYLGTQERVNNIYSMDTNRRSSAEFITAMNNFFQPDEDFDTFAYGAGKAGIKYIPVKSPDPNSHGSLLEKGNMANGIRISKCKGLDEIHHDVLQFVKGLLIGETWKISKNDVVRKVIPSDIGILVRSNKEGRIIRGLLAKYGIPAVTLADAKLMKCPEADELLLVMLAVNDISVANINRALMTSLGRFDDKKLLLADTDALLERFRNYQDTWKKNGVYVMFRRFLADCRFEEILSDGTTRNPERKMSNVLQLVELLHKVSERRRYDQREQILWLQRGKEGELRDGDEYLQRIESDEEAVRIVTIHKSKGLEYNIVISPHLDIKYSPNGNINYRDPDTGAYMYAAGKTLPEELKELAKEQNVQENRRLLYVAVTRARYLCFITALVTEKKKGGKENKEPNSALEPFRDALEKLNVPPDFIELDWKPTEVNERYVRTAEMQHEKKYAEAPDFDKKLRNRNWKKTSYSALSPDHPPIPVERTSGPLPDLEQFAFRDLQRGTHTGNLLHYIFERIDFTSEKGWADVIDKTLKRMPPRRIEPLSFRNNLVALFRHIVGVGLPGTKEMSLSRIEWSHRLSELEFDFPLSEFNTSELAAIGHEHGTPFFTRPDESLEGLMNGKIDLIFRYEGKYYILDWKSNHLGDQVNDYSYERIREAMADNNYHLQYHIYTVALCKYLRTRLPDFDYERDFGGCFYLFVRGMRTGGDTGVFFHKPEASVIDKMQALTAITG